MFYSTCHVCLSLNVFIFKILMCLLNRRGTVLNFVLGCTKEYWFGPVVSSCCLLFGINLQEPFLLWRDLIKDQLFLLEFCSNKHKRENNFETALNDRKWEFPESSGTASRDTFHYVQTKYLFVHCSTIIHCLSLSFSLLLKITRKVLNKLK